MHDPVTDFFAFLTKPFYGEPYFVHFVYWVLAIISISIAFAAWGAVPGQERLTHIWRFFMRFIVGSFWWEQSLWKFPTDTGGLRYWTEQEVKHTAVAFWGQIIKTVILPIFQPFAYAVYGFEVLVAVMILLGLYVRVFSSLGALLIASLWIGLYNAPGEWPWSYVFLLLIMVIMVVDNYGYSLGLDAYLEARSPAARRRRASAMAPH